jgi:hypothetical protein
MDLAGIVSKGPGVFPFAAILMTAPAFLSGRKDPWVGYWKTRQSLRAAMETLGQGSGDCAGPDVVKGGSSNAVFGGTFKLH